MLTSALHQILERHARADPGRPAVWYGEEHLTYYELNRCANRLARYIRSLDLSPMSPVGVLLDRGLDLIVALVGILKAGAAYLPLDPANPPARIEAIVHDAGIQLVLTQPSLEKRLPRESARFIALGLRAALIARQLDTNPDYPVTCRQPAYVIYTSGSTGRPKGVAVAHHSVLHLFSKTAPLLHLNEHDVWTVVHSTSFDFSVWEIWGALLHGAQLVVVPAAVTLSPAHMAALLRKRKVTILSQTPSALRELLREAPTLCGVRALICGGEGLPHDMVPRSCRRASKHGTSTGPRKLQSGRVARESRLTTAAIRWYPSAEPFLETTCTFSTPVCKHRLLAFPASSTSAVSNWPWATTAGPIGQRSGSFPTRSASQAAVFTKPAMRPESWRMGSWSSLEGSITRSRFMDTG